MRGARAFGRGPKLSGPRLSRARLSRARLSRARLSGPRLTGVRASRTRATRVCRMRSNRMGVSSYITLDEVRRIRKVLPDAAGDRALGEGAKKRDMHP
jgi:hypothetical protein